MLVEVAVAIAGYVFRDQVKSEFNKSFQQQMQNYLKDNKTATILDKLQKEVSGMAGRRVSRDRRFSALN